MEAQAYAAALLDRIYSVSCSCNQARPHSDASRTWGGCRVCVSVTGRCQKTTMTTAPHEVEKTLHELELLSLQGL